MTVHGPERPCLDAGDRRQRAREGGAANRAARRLPSRGVDRARGRRLPRRGARRAAASRRGARPAARGIGPARRRDDRAAPLLHALADDGRGVRAPERDSRDRRADRRPQAAPGQRAEDVDPIVRSILDADHYELETIERFGRTRSRLDAPLWQAISELGRGNRAGRKGSATLLREATDSHWLREAFDTVCYGFFPLRTMNAELAARLIHSADERTLTWTTSASAPTSCARSLARWPDRARAALARRRVRANRVVPGRARGFLRPRRRGARRRPLPGLRPLGPLRRTPVPAPPEAVPPAPRSRGRPGHVPVCPRDTSRSASGSARGPSRRTRRRSRRCGSDPGAATSTRSTSSSIRRRVRRLGGGARRALDGFRPRGRGRRRLGGGVGLARALPRPPRPARPRRADQGRAPLLGEHVEGDKDAAEHVMIVDLERNDLSRSASGLGLLARADGGAGARRRHAPRLDGRGHAPRRRRPGRAARGDLPRRLRHRSAEARRPRPDRGARAGRPRRLDGGARSRARQRRPRAGADDPRSQSRPAGSTSGSAAASSGTRSPTPRSRSRGRRRGRC